MPVSDVGVDKIVEALEYFDDTMRDTDAWQGWESRRSHLYAIRWRDKLYPAWEAVRTATGSSGFRGGFQANQYLRARGFEVIPLRHDEIRFSQDILARLDRMLQKFAEYRSDEACYLAEERTYKEELFDHLGTIWDLLYTDPEASQKALIKFISGEDAPAGLLAAFNNLQGGYGLPVRDDFLVYLRNTSADEY